MVPNARDVFGRYFTVKIKLPSDIVGKQSTFVLGYSTDDGPGTVCEVDEASVTVRSGYNSFNETVKADNGFFKLAIPDEFTVNGFLTVEFVLPPNYGNLDGPCSFLINEVKI
jgi:hypothetical protein